MKLRLTESVESVFETDVLEFPQTRDFLLINRYVSGRTMTAPVDAQDREDLIALLIRLSNSYDDQAEYGLGEGRSNKRFCKGAAWALSTLSAKLSYY